MAKANFVLSGEIMPNDDLEDASIQGNALNYKGVFFAEHVEQKYFQGGAHFEFSDLCRRLNSMLSNSSFDKDHDKKEIETKKINNMEIKEKGVENKKIQSRNINKFHELNTLKTLQFLKSNNNQNQISNVFSSKQNILNGTYQKNENSMNSYICNNTIKFDHTNQNLEKKNKKNYNFDKQIEIFKKISSSGKKETKNFVFECYENNNKEKKDQVNEFYKSLGFFLKKKDEKSRLNGMNKSLNSSKKNNLAESNANRNYKQLVFLDLNNNDKLSKNTSHLFINESSLLKNTFYKDGTFLNNNSYNNIDSLKKSTQVKSSDSNRNGNIYQEKTAKDVKMNFDLSKFKSNQKKYTEIYSKKQTTKDQSKNNLFENLSNIKSRNQKNNFINSKTDNRPNYRTFNNRLVLAQNLKYNKSQLIQVPFKNSSKINDHSLNGFINSFNNNRSQTKLDKTSFLINNYLNTNRPLNSNLKQISLKKPASICNLYSKNKAPNSFKKDISEVFNIDFSQSKENFSFVKKESNKQSVGAGFLKKITFNFENKPHGISNGK